MEEEIKDLFVKLINRISSLPEPLSESDENLIIYYSNILNRVITKKNIK